MLKAQGVNGTTSYSMSTPKVMLTSNVAMAAALAFKSNNKAPYFNHAEVCQSWLMKVSKPAVLQGFNGMWLLFWLKDCPPKAKKSRNWTPRRNLWGTSRVRLREDTLDATGGSKSSWCSMVWNPVKPSSFWKILSPDFFWVFWAWTNIRKYQHTQKNWGSSLVTP